MPLAIGVADAEVVVAPAQREGATVTAREQDESTGFRHGLT
jgi:hypothetical protein